MQMAVLWPFGLAILAYTAYQVALKLARPDVNILGLLAFAYLAAGVTAVLLWLRNPDLGENRLTGPDLLLAGIIGVSIVGIEFGFASAFRSGNPINTTGAIVNVATALLVIPIGFAVFGEEMSMTRWVGVAMCCGGLALLAWK